MGTELSDEAAVIASEIRSAHRLGCTNHGCVWGHPGGIGTNATCKCLHHMNIAQEARAAAGIRGLRALLLATRQREREKDERIEALQVVWRLIDELHTCKNEVQEGCDSEMPCSKPEGHQGECSHSWQERLRFATGEQAERIRELEAERAELGHHLSNLLAAIHRDGGHYEADHGTVDAVEDGIEVVKRDRVVIDELVEALRKLHAITGELTTRIDADAEDVGCDAREVGEILPELGPAVDEAGRLLQRAESGEGGA